MKFLFTVFIFLLLAYFVVQLLKKIWYKLHQIVGIEVGISRYALPLTPPLHVSHQPTTKVPNSIMRDKFIHDSFANDKQYQLRQSNYQTTSRSKNQPTTSILGIEADCIGRMPTQAVMLLDEINDKLIRYQSWLQHQSDQSPQTTAWLTENKFVINRLVSNTIPEAISQYDQIAQFHPTQLYQPIYAQMTAGEMLIEVLSQVNNQLTSLLDEMFQEVSQQFTSTYRYVKTRIN